MVGFRFSAYKAFVADVGLGDTGVEADEVIEQEVLVVKLVLALALEAVLDFECVFFGKWGLTKSMTSSCRGSFVLTSLSLKQLGPECWALFLSCKTPLLRLTISGTSRELHSPVLFTCSEVDIPRTNG